jgi:hypothetical protein
MTVVCLLIAGLKLYDYIDDKFATYKEEEVFISDWSARQVGEFEGHAYVFDRIDEYRKKYGEVQFKMNRVEDGRDDSGYRVIIKWKSRKDSE